MNRPVYGMTGARLAPRDACARACACVCALMHAFMHARTRTCALVRVCVLAQVDNRGSARRGLAFEGAIKNGLGKTEVLVYYESRTAPRHTGPFPATLPARYPRDALLRSHAVGIVSAEPSAGQCPQ